MIVFYVRPMLSHACAMSAKQKRKRKAMHAPCIFFKGRSQPMQAHPFQLILNTNGNFLAKVAHLSMGAKK